MTQNIYVASKRDIIIFFIISIFYSVITYIIVAKPIIKEGYILFFLFYLPEIIAIIINLIIKYANIQNEKALRVTKILFNIFAFIHFALFGFLVYAFNAIG